MPMPVRTLQETATALDGPAVLAAAVDFFARQNGIYSAFPEKEGPTYVALRGQGNEEVLIGVQPLPGGTRVTGSSYLFDQQIARFLASLPAYIAPPEPPAPPALPDGATDPAPAA